MSQNEGGAEAVGPARTGGGPDCWGQALDRGTVHGPIKATGRSNNNFKQITNTKKMMLNHNFVRIKN
jgi:hypothetical protein